MFDWIADPNAWVALAALTALEVVLGVDNIIFISILVGRLPEAQRDSARRLGLGLAMGTRILSLLSIAWVMRLMAPVHPGSGVLGARSDSDRRWAVPALEKRARDPRRAGRGRGRSRRGTGGLASYGGTLMQVAILDIVFSLDSVTTAVGPADDLAVMVIAIVLSVLVMMFAAKPIGEFVERRPTHQDAGVVVPRSGWHDVDRRGLETHVPKGYIYFAMALSLGVEMINIRLRSRRKWAPTTLRKKAAP